MVTGWPVIESPFAEVVRTSYTEGADIKSAALRAGLPARFVFIPGPAAGAGETFGIIDASQRGRIPEFVQQFR